MQFLYFLSCFCLTSLSAYFSFFLTFPRYSDTHSPLLSLIITFFLFFTFSFSPSLSPFPFDFALFPLCRSGQKVIYWYLVYLNQTQNQIDCTKKKKRQTCCLFSAYTLLTSYLRLGCSVNVLTLIQCLQQY